MKKVRLYLMGEKGLHVLKSIVANAGAASVECVVSTRDKNLLIDYYTEIKSFCLDEKIPFFNRTSCPPEAEDYSFAIGWQYLIQKEGKLIVFHDSLLPRHRGFNPLVTALINGDDKVGVTALYGTKDYDCGDIIEQKSLAINYPVKISEAISKIKFLYSDIAMIIMNKIKNGDMITAVKQDESLATFSLWRDELDYFIDWNWSASQIERFINAVGAPYQGAQTYADGVRIIVNQAISLPNLVIENRTPGKVIMSEKDFPVVVCGSGLLQIIDATIFSTKEPLLPIKKFRTRFHNNLESRNI